MQRSATHQFVWAALMGEAIGLSTDGPQWGGIQQKSRFFCGLPSGKHTKNYGKIHHFFFG